MDTFFPFLASAFDAVFRQPGATGCRAKIRLHCFRGTMLSQHSRVVLDTLLPRRAHLTLKYGLFDTGFETFWSVFERTALPSLRWSFRAALFAATWIAPLLIRRLPPLTLHDRPTRERALAAMASSRYYILRQLFVVLKTTVGFCYGADRNVRDAIGYPRQHDDPRGKVAP